MLTTDNELFGLDVTSLETTLTQQADDLLEYGDLDELLGIEYEALLGYQETDIVFAILKDDEANVHHLLTEAATHHTEHTDKLVQLTVDDVPLLLYVSPDILFVFTPKCESAAADSLIRSLL